MRTTVIVVKSFAKMSHCSITIRFHVHGNSNFMPVVIFHASSVVYAIEEGSYVRDVSERSSHTNVKCYCRLVHYIFKRTFSGYTA